MMKQKIFRPLAKIASPGGAKGKLQIFIFHRVLDKPDALIPYEPDVQRFDSIINAISSVFNVIPLDEAVQALNSGCLPPRAACITFDDGYADNYTNALPVLLKYRVPTTVFIATDYIGGQAMWNDVVIESIRAFSGEFTLESLNIFARECHTDEQKYTLINQVLNDIKHRPQAERQELVEQVKSDCDHYMQPLMMNEEQIKGLYESGVIIGAHTRSHPILANLDDSTSYEEIATSREILSGLLKDNIELFAYPNGKPVSDYTDKDVENVRKAGFSAAVSTRQSVATGNDDVFQLPRFSPWDMNLDKYLLRSIYENFRAR